MIDKTNYKYNAFISYSHKDIKTAIWIQKKLEHYKVPPSLEKESDREIPKSIGPIFRDQTDLNTGILESNLKSELDDSMYLIVLCSPNSASSKWVNKEVQHFIEIGRKDFIIPIIIDDKSKNYNECYPPALQSLNILGSSIKELKPTKVLTRIVALILGIKYDSLWNRQARWRRKRNRIRLATVSSMMIIFLLSAYSIWINKYRESSEYFNDYIIKYGVAEGLHPIEEEQVKNLNMCYKIDKIGSTTVSISKVNSKGNLCNDDTAIRDKYMIRSERLPARVTYIYKENGELDTATYYRHNGIIMYRLQYIDQSHADIINGYSPCSIAWSNNIEADYYNSPAINGEYVLNITRFIYEYDEYGRISKKTYAESKNYPVGNNGEGIIEYEYNNADEILSIGITDSYGFSSTTYSNKTYYSRDINRNITCIDDIFLLQDGSSQAVSNQLYYDKHGNLIEVVYDDELRHDGHIFVPIHLRYTKYQLFDELLLGYRRSDYIYSGQTSEQYTYNETGELVKYVELPKSNARLISYDYIYDFSGYLVVRSKYDNMGEFIISERLNYENNRLKTISYYDEEGKHIEANLDGKYYASISMTYFDDNESYGIKYYYYDIEGLPKMFEGAYSIKVQRDKNHDIYIVSNYNEDDILTIAYGMYAIKTFVYKSNKTIISTYDENNKLTLIEDPMANISYAIEIIELDTDIYNSNEIHSLYDENSKRVSYTDN